MLMIDAISLLHDDCPKGGEGRRGRERGREALSISTSRAIPCYPVSEECSGPVTNASFCFIESHRVGEKPTFPRYHLSLSVAFVYSTCRRLLACFAAVAVAFVSFSLGCSLYVEEEEEEEVVSE